MLKLLLLFLITSIFFPSLRTKLITQFPKLAKIKYKQKDFQNYLSNSYNLFFHNIFRTLNDLLPSDSIASLAYDYGNNLNLSLLRGLINSDSKLGSKIVLTRVESVETIGKLMIAKVYFSGQTKREVTNYIEHTISKAYPELSRYVQVNTINSHHLKIILPGTPD